MHGSGGKSEGRGDAGAVQGVVRKQRIRTILIRALISLSLVTLGLISVIFSVMQYRTLKSNATRDMRSSCARVASGLGQTVKEMDTILLYSIASGELKDEFQTYMKAGNPFKKNRARQSLAGTMISLKGFDFATRQLNLYDIEEGGYGVGNYNGDLPFAARYQSWYEDTLSLSGKKYIFAPARDELASNSAGISRDTLYFSICRLFYGDFHTPLGFIEVKAYYDEVFESLKHDISALNPVIAVYDSEGRQIYPQEEVFSYYSFKDAGDGEILNTNTGRKQYLCFSEDKDNGLIVAMAVDDAVFMEPVYRSFIPIILAVCLIFVFCLVFAAALARRLSDPIGQIYAFLLDAEKPQFARLDAADSGILEIDELRDSINDSIRLQENATQTMLTLKEQEMQAEMLALQSQMNPHFLYNSLSMIGEMAESGMTDQVSEMCEDITSILRYISSNREMRIRVEEEMEQVDRYLGCMQKRFGGGLHYTYDISDDILDCMVPKLCIQLLVENAVKAVMTHREPWEIRVEGARDGDDWHVTVMDNGPGFDPEVDRELRSNMDEILRTGVLPSLKIEGMGILNIFIRLYLLDGIPFVFDFGNKDDGGAFVTVGGHVRNSDDASLM